MASQSVGDVMSEGRNRAFKALAILAGVVVYSAALAYSAVHNYTLLVRGLPDDMVALAIVGVVALEISAAALPVALHFWLHAPLQRIAGFAFYAVDLALIFFNVLLSFAMTAGEPLTDWLKLYLWYGAPGVPLFCAAGWSLLFLLDPSQRQLAMVEALRASTREALSARIAEQAKSADISESVDLAAAQLAREIIAGTLATPVKAAPRPLPARLVGHFNAETAAAPDLAQSDNGRAK